MVDEIIFQGVKMMIKADHDRLYKIQKISLYKSKETDKKWKKENLLWRSTNLHDFIVQNVFLIKKSEKIL